MRSLRLSIDGMTCAACATQIEHALSKLDDLERASVSLQLMRTTVLYDADRLSTSDVEEAVRGAGYEVRAGDRTTEEKVEVLSQGKQLKILRSTLSSAATISGILVAVDAIRLSLPQELGLRYDFALFAVNLVLGSWVQLLDARWIHESAWGRTGTSVSVNMDTLISLSLSLGLLLSLFNMSLQGWKDAETYFATGCFLTTVITAGRCLDLALKKSGASNFTELYRLQSETALVQVSSSENYIPASLVRKNIEIILEPMSIIPCDCYVLEGSTVVDEATITGESFPVTKVVGDFLLSGTKNLSNRVVAIVSAEQQDSSLERLIESISSALEQKSDDHGRLDTAMGYFVSTIIVIAALSFASSFLKTNGLLLDRINSAAQRAMAVLAASCPCALGLATPSATMAAVDAAWTRGALLIGGKKTLNALSSVTHIVMDKTGVDRVLCQRLLYLAEREIAQSHAAGKAVFQWALHQLETAPKRVHSGSKVEELEIVPGKGVPCIITDLDWTSNTIHIGSERFLQDAGISNAQSKLSDRNQNRILIHFAINHHYSGYLILQEKIREEAPSVIRKLQAKGLDITMLTGDTNDAAARVSTTLNLPVLAGRSLPHEKKSWIRSLQAKGGIVAMIGDGINNSPAQAAADVGILLSVSRTCVTGAADVVIMSPSLATVPMLLEIANMAVNQATLNVRWAIGYNLVSVTLASGMLERWGLLVDVSLAGTLMALSSLIILIMSLQLRRRLSNI